jgi:hypothetical protein
VVYRAQLCFLHNAPTIFSQPGVVATIRYSIIQGGWRGDGNQDLDPLLRGRAGFESLQTLTAPCIDHGDPKMVDGVYDRHPLGGWLVGLGPLSMPQRCCWLWA